MILLSEVMVFILVSISVTVVLSRGFIFEAPKKYILSKVKNQYVEYLLTCPMCLGFWIGLILAILIDFRIYHGAGIFNYIMAGFLCSAFSIVLDRIVYKPDKELKE